MACLGFDEQRSNRVLKKSVHGLFQPKLAKVNFANLAKSLAFTARAFRRAVLARGSRLFFNSLPRGVLAEFIVACALGVADQTRLEWDACDLITRSGKKLEVKSAAYIQTWDQKKPSRIVFSIAPSKGWEARTNTYHQEYKRLSDVYVFCLLKHQDQDTIDPLNLDQWDFLILPTAILDEKAPGQKTITLKSLDALGAAQTDFSGLARCLDNLCKV